MLMKDFCDKFASSRSFRRKVLADAQSNDDAAKNDLACVACIYVWQQGSQGKSKACQIQITFFIAKRGSGAANPYVVSTANPPTPTVKALNQAIIPVMQGVSAVKNEFLAPSADARGIKGAFTKFGLSVKRHATTKSRAADSTLFDAVLAELTALGSPIATYAAGLGDAPPDAAFNNGDNWLTTLRRNLTTGIDTAAIRKRADFDLGDIGLT